MMNLKENQILWPYFGARSPLMEIVEEGASVVLFDLESTLSEVEMWLTIAQLRGGGAIVEMVELFNRGVNIDNLRGRIEIAHLTSEDLLFLSRLYPLHLVPDCQICVSSMRSLGIHMGIVTQGFADITGDIHNALGLSIDGANQFAYDRLRRVVGLYDSVLTSASGKRDHIEDLRNRSNLGDKRTIMVGDGGSDKVTFVPENPHQSPAVDLFVHFTGVVDRGIGQDTPVTVGRMASLFALVIGEQRRQMILTGRDTLARNLLTRGMEQVISEQGVRIGDACDQLAIVDRFQHMIQG